MNGYESSSKTSTTSRAPRFRSQARVIDLLGRQQIADSPTAMGEIFKNALDAGARNVWIDYQEKHGTLVVRDDGLGMRPQDVLNKWLVLATDSSHRLIEDDDGWLAHADKDQRAWLSQPKYGEKGIGRLSVSSLGRMVFLWTVWGDGPAKTGSLCLVHWNLFQHPGKLFEDLPIPFASFNRPAKVDDLQSLIYQLRDDPVVEELIADQRWDQALRSELSEDARFDCSNLGSWPFGWEVGTTFCVLGLTEQVPDLFLKAGQDVDPGDEYSPDILKSYHTFANFWDPFHKHPARNFTLHPTKDGVKLSRVHRYWETSDFAECDHHIRIEITAEGFASGLLKDFGKQPVSYQRQLKHLPRGYKSPGPFIVEIGYVQGNANQEFSDLPADVFKEINDRLKHCGGFSIYRNNVRIQPYGTIDNDFFGFEQRRLKNAGRYYFSKLRMFGGVFLPAERAPALQEKAGREGFVANGARRALHLWVEDLFVDLADSYYGRKADREDKRVAKKNKEAARARQRLMEEKTSYLNQVRVSRGWLRDFAKRSKDAIHNAKGFVSSERNAKPGTHLKSCRTALENLRTLATELRQSTSEAPIGVTLEGDEIQAVDSYLAIRGEELRKLDRIIANLTQDIESLTHRAEGEQEQVIIYRRRISDTDVRIKREASEILEPVLDKVPDLAERLIDFADAEIAKTQEARDLLLGDLTAEVIAKDATGESAKKLEQALQAQEDTYDEVVKPRLKRLASEMAHLMDETSGTLVLQDMADELSRLRHRETFLVEMAQVGLIAEAANHEHEHQVTVVRDNIRILGKKVDSTLARAVEGLSNAFEIIDARIRLFDPLIRRSGIISQTLTGDEIEEFLKHHFADAFASGLIKTTGGFKKASLPAVKKPVMLGAVHNIVHNAMYWCRQGVEKPAIRLTGAGSRITISDSGPGIAKRDKSRIFEPGFSRRPFGRGLGLYVGRQALAGVGFDLICPEYPEPGALEGANFLIQPKSPDNDPD